MDAILMANGDLVQRLKWFVNKENEKHYINSERYLGFSQNLGDFGIVLAGDVIDSLKEGGKLNIPIYKVEKNLLPYDSKQNLDKIHCKVYIASGFDPTGRHATSEELELMMNYFESKKKEGVFEGLINSKKATFFEDKVSVIDLAKNTNVLAPRTYHLDNFDDVKHLCKTEKKDLILKHRWGYGGNDVSKINLEKLSQYENLDFTEFIIQEELDIIDECRIMIFDKTYLGARVIIDRTRPWENKAEGKRVHEVKSYEPSEQEIRDTIEVFKYATAELGCVDWVHCKDGKRYFMEFNGPASGYGYTGGSFNLNETIPKMIRKKYL